MAFSRYYTYIEPLMRNEKQKAYGMLVLSLFAIAFFGIFAIRPTILTIVSLQREITETKQLDNKLSQKMKALSQAQEVLNRLSVKQPLVREALPPNPNVAQLLRTFENQASQTKVSLGSVQFRSVELNGEEISTASGAATLAAQTDVSAPTQTAPAAAPAAPSLNTLKIQFTVTGTPATIYDFLHRLTITRRIVVVDEVRLASKEQAAPTTADISVRAFQMLQK